MAGQVMGAVAPIVIQSATNEEGIVNRLFKIAILLGVLLIIGIVIFGIFYFFNSDFQEVIQNTAGAGAGLIAGLLPFGISQPFRILQIGLTGLISGFAFGGRRG
jgi:amino acid permease